MNHQLLERRLLAKISQQPQRVDLRHQDVIQTSRIDRSERARDARTMNLRTYEHVRLSQDVGALDEIIAKTEPEFEHAPSPLSPPFERAIVI